MRLIEHMCDYECKDTAHTGTEVRVVGGGFMEA